jgi:UDP-N-acetylglucosamine 2-epimerase (non-hydrolysing)
MPEEQNRKVTDALSTVLLTHCADANDNLRAEGVADDLISFVGNTMIDTLLDNVDAARELEAWRGFGVERGNYILATLHRPALVDNDALLATTLVALADVARELPVVFPMHPRTRVRLDRLALDTTGITIVEPLPYRTFLSLEEAAAGVITDSGGLQEETTALDVPCFTLRANTERPVTISHGTNTLLGLDPSRLVEVPNMLSVTCANGGPPLWDGCAGERAALEIERVLELALVAAA